MAPDPGAPAGRAARGRLKVYLGFAAGVGKTYAMLEDAQRARAAGAEVLIGYIEPHARPETAALTAGLEVVPPRRVEQAGAVQFDLDLPAVLARRPAIVLVDELAHTNPPGSPHAKRYEDVEALLAAGWRVWTTLNVQHLESLSDQIASLTHARQRETLPDAFLAREAEELVVVDVPAEELRQRIRDGKVYPLERAEAALDGFFRAERLTALRELALREMARLIEDRRVAAVGGSDSPLAAAVPAVAERMLILAAGRPGDERIVREGWRLARSLQCDVRVVHVGRPGGEGLREVETACRMLALPLVVLPPAPGRGGIGAALAGFAREHRATHVLAGVARDRRLPWRGSTLQAIMDRVPWVDFIVVGDPARRGPEAVR